MATYRLFKLPELEGDCEDYGETIIYKGTVASSPQSFTLDSHHTMEAGRVFPVSRNTWHMLMGTRFARHFDKIGDGLTHGGIYPNSGKTIPFVSAAAPVSQLPEQDGDVCVANYSKKSDVFRGDPIKVSYPY